MSVFKILSKIKPESLTSELEIKDKAIFHQNENLFEFDEVFDANSDNKKVFESIKSTVDNVFRGISANIIAFGMPGNGKSHTLFGTKSDGLFNYIINYICDDLRKQTQKDVVIKISYFDIINSRIKDLLGSSNSLVTVAFDPICQKSKYVNLKQYICLSKSSFEHYKKSGDDKRQQKYKGHTIFRVIIELIESNSIDNLKRSTISNLDFIELNYNDSGPFVKFICNIQSKEETFENCISAVLYKSYLGLGNTVLICNIALSNIKETKQILKLATSARQFKGNPIIERFVQHDENYFINLNTELNELIKICKSEDNKNNLLLTKLSSVQKQEFLKSYHAIELHLVNLRENFCKNDIFSQIIDDIFNDFRNLLFIMEPKNVSMDKNHSFCRKGLLENKLFILGSNLHTLKMKCVPNYLQGENNEGEIKFISPGPDKGNRFDYFVHNNTISPNVSVFSPRNKENQSPVDSYILNVSKFSPFVKAEFPVDVNIATVATVNTRQVTNPEFDTKSYIVSNSMDKSKNSQWKSYVTERVLVKSQSVQTD